MAIDPVSIVVDDAIWPWRGDRWAHLVSDRDVAELHEFAHRLGLRRMSFQGDHYDVNVGQRARAVAAGAVEVPARELLRRLRAAGLRVRAGRGEWRWTLHAELSAVPDAAFVTALDASLQALLGHHPFPVAVRTALAGPAPGGPARSHGLCARVASRPGEVAIVLHGRFDALSPLTALSWGPGALVHLVEGGNEPPVPSDVAVLEVFIPGQVRVDG